MNKAKMNTTKRNFTNAQQLFGQVPVAAQNSSEPITAKRVSGSACGIDVHKMVEDAALIREQKANAVKTSKLSETKTIEPTGLFNKRTGGR